MPVRFDALVVVTVGGDACVVNDKTVPNEVPRLLLAIEQKWYVVAGKSPVTPNENATGLVPVPNDASDALLEGTRVPKESLHVTGLIEL